MYGTSGGGKRGRSLGRLIAVRGGYTQKEHGAEKESVDSKLAVVRYSADCSLTTMRPKEG
jgi:hypothetical protein